MKTILALIIAALLIVPIGLAADYRTISASEKVSSLNQMKAAMMANSASSMRMPARPAYVSAISRMGRRTPATSFTANKQNDIRTQGMMKVGTRSEKISALYAQKTDSRRLTTSRFSSSSFKFLGLGGLIK